MLICCKKSSYIAHENNRDFHLHLQKKNRNIGLKKPGFTIVEVLIVVLVIGIISGTAIGSYSGAIEDTRIRSASDRINTFFQACKSKAKLRKIDVKIVYNESSESFVDQNSTITSLKVPELCSDSIPKLIEIDKNGNFKIAGKTAEELKLALKNSNNKLATITIKL